MSNIENLKKSIRTILDQLPKYYSKFDVSEHELITEFLAVIMHFEEADNKRTALTKHFSCYSEIVIKSIEYQTTPFLWYTESLSDNAITNLSISRFHAIEFYKFLLYQLRKLHKLIMKGTKLSSYKYEQLQAECEKADFILTSEEFEILKTTYSSIEDNKTESLSSKYIKKKINENMAIASKYKRESEVTRFYTLVGGKWGFQFNSPSFGLRRVFFHIQLSKNFDLKQVIDFNNLENTVLGLSDVDQVLNSKKEYLGTLLVPNRDIKILNDYFEHFEDKKYMRIKEFTTINHVSRSTAFSLYKPDNGWQKLPSKRRKAIIQKFKTNEEEERHYYDSAKIPSQWSFTEYPYPLDIIKFYCKAPDKFSYSQLPFDRIMGKEKQFSIAEIGILRYLITKKALDVGFTPWRLIYNFSVNEYCIKLPKIPLKKLAHFLNIIPFGETYFSDHHTYIWTRLPVELISMIKNDLKWTILPISRINPLSDLDFSWFDNARLEWISPKVLQM
ncbi:MAG: hypothetical protein ACTSRJ_05740 [Candidatus Hodarchaeales archaeon]